ncbi:radical SAM protein [Acidobacteria bacterium AH-259-D05]|nr:radical SAM protein [Acidobacteria bacterium AH-259-D05]
MITTAIKSTFLFWQQRRSLPQTLILFVTSRCNARCDFCCYFDQIENPVAKEQELKIPEIQEIAQRYGKLHYLALSGGEPFIRDDLEPLCQAFIDSCGTAVVDIPSNFYYTKKMLATMEPLVRNNPGVIFDLQMSIDHVGEAHDRSRKVKNLYRKAIDSFRALSKVRAKHSNLKLKINIVYLDRNRESLDQIVSELGRLLDYDRVQLTYPHKLVPREWGPQSSAALDVRAYMEKAETLSKEAPLRNLFDLHTLGLRSVKSVYHRLLTEAVSNERNVGSYCEAGRYILVINEKGDVFPCEPLWECIGNLRDYDYDTRAVLAAEAYQQFRDRRLGPNKCNCTWSCAVHSSISVQPKYLPQLGVNAAQLLVNHIRNSPQSD